VKCNKYYIYLQHTFHGALRCVALRCVALQKHMQRVAAAQDPGAVPKHENTKKYGCLVRVFVSSWQKYGVIDGEERRLKRRPFRAES
jgi:hypothetical protein